MFSDPVSLLLLALSFVVTFFTARALGTGWRERRRKKAEEAARAGESRQVRRARERQKRR